jgi:hypothetical protein
MDVLIIYSYYNIIQITKEGIVLKKTKEVIYEFIRFQFYAGGGFVPDLQ